MHNILTKINIHLRETLKNKFMLLENSRPPPQKKSFPNGLSLIFKIAVPIVITRLMKTTTKMIKPTTYQSKPTIKHN